MTDHQVLLFLFAVFGFIGAVFVLVAVLVSGNSKKKREKCSFGVDAVVTDYVRTRSGRIGGVRHGSHHIASLAPVFEYNYEGRYFKK